MSLVQAAQAQQTASKARDRERAQVERTQRYTDHLELRVANLESSEAVRQLPRNDSEEADVERQAKDESRLRRDDDDEAHVDVTA